MKCKHCGAKVGANRICPKCGLSYPIHGIKKKKKALIISGVTLAVLAGGCFAFALIYDHVHQNDALLPGNAGMTKQELYATLKRTYNPLYDGKVLENPNVREGADKLSYVAYTDYCKALTLMCPMELEVTFVTYGNTQYVDSYTLSLPYLMKSDDDVQKAIQQKVIPVLEEKYGSSDDSGALYSAHFGIRESVTMQLGHVGDLLDHENYQQLDFSVYNAEDHCCRITYQGNSSHTFWNVMKYVKE